MHPMEVVALTLSLSIGGQINYIRPRLRSVRTGKVIRSVMEPLSQLLPRREDNYQLMIHRSALDHTSEPELPSRRGINRPLNPSSPIPLVKIKRFPKLRVVKLVLLNGNHRTVGVINMKDKSQRATETARYALNLRGQINRKRISRSVCFLPVNTIISNITNLDVISTIRIPHRHREVKLIEIVNGNPSRSDLIRTRTTLGHQGWNSPSNTVVISVIELMITLPIQGNMDIIIRIYTSPGTSTPPMRTR